MQLGFFMYQVFKLQNLLGELEGADYPLFYKYGEFDVVIATSETCIICCK